MVFLGDDGYVSMPLWYWLELTDYIIDTQELQISLEGATHDGK